MIDHIKFYFLCNFNNYKLILHITLFYVYAFELVKKISNNHFLNVFLTIIVSINFKNL